MNLRASLALGLAVVAGVAAASSACVGDDPAAATPSTGGGNTDGGSGSSSGSSGGSSGGPDASALPAPVSIDFWDEDMTAGKVSGTVRLVPPADETRIRRYELAWANGATKIATAASIDKGDAGGAAYSNPLSGPTQGATHLLAYSVGDNGEVSAPVSLGNIDNEAKYVDISAGQGQSSGRTPSAVIDAANKKLLVATTSQGLDGNAVNATTLFVCGLDGTNCVARDATATLGPQSGVAPSMVIDVNATSTRKLFIVASTMTGSDVDKPWSRLCALDGTDCVGRDTTAAQGNNSGHAPSTVMDDANKRLLIVTQNDSGGAGSKPSLFRCDASQLENGGTPATWCTFADLSAGQAAGCGAVPSAVVDTINKKLLVATTNGANGSKVSLFQCGLDGTSCTHTDISSTATPAQGDGSGMYPQLLIDVSNKKLLVVTRNDANGTRPALYRCDLDGTKCSYADISAGQGVSSATLTSAVIDPTTHKLLVAATNGGNGNRLSLYHCDLDGTHCSHSDISAGQAASSGFSPSAVFDASSGRLLIATENRANAEKPALFMVGPVK